MRVLVTGANGMLGLDLCPILEQAGHEVIRTDVSVREGLNVPPWISLDITDWQAVRDILLDKQPDAVVHGAAYTDVDGCERNPDLAYKVNALGTWNLASICGGHHITMLYVSTDFVFDGEKEGPYTEFDTPNPVSHYGASKLAGERIVAQLCRQHFVARTAWLFGAWGNNFPFAILRHAATKPELAVVSDQVGSPTHTVDLAMGIVALLTGPPLYGTYHLTNSGSCSRVELAERTLELAGLSHVRVKPILSSEFPTPTRRPANSVLRRYSLELQGRDTAPSWQDALAHMIQIRQSQTS